MEKVFVSMEEVIIVLQNLKQENQAYHESIVHLQIIKLQHLWDAFSRPSPNQRSHKSICLTSLITHGQNFEVLSTKYA
jgi:hypothetical protein